MTALVNIGIAAAPGRIVVTFLLFGCHTDPGFLNVPELRYGELLFGFVRQKPRDFRYLDTIRAPGGFKPRSGKHDLHTDA